MEEKDLQALAERLREGLNINVGNGFRLKTILITGVICAVIGAGLGAFAWDAIEAAAARHKLELAQKDLAVEKAKPPIQVPVTVKGQDTHTISYVEKPVYIDQKTGQKVTDQADVVVTSGAKSSFTFGLIGLNGKRKDYIFNKTADEKQIFDKNQLQWNTDWNFTGSVDVRDLVEEVAAARVDKAVEDTKRKYLKHYSAGVDYWTSGRLDGHMGYTPNGVLEYRVLKNISGGNTTTVGSDVGAGVTLHF